MEREFVSREEFERQRSMAAAALARDEELLQTALDVKVKAGHDYLWVHQTNWMGEPCLQLPTDLLAIAEVVFKTRPKFVIECGVAWGGTSLFLASLLALTGGQQVVGIDIYMPEDLRLRLRDHGRISDRICLYEGSTTDSRTVDFVKETVGDTDEVLVLLDSHHTHDHVLAELNMYAPLVGIGHYLICGDTAIARQPPAPLRPRPWGEGDNPATALAAYLNQDHHVDLVVDREIEDKLLMSNNWGGYLRRRS